jgi:hypothetical protein
MTDSLPGLRFLELCRDRNCADPSKSDEEPKKESWTQGVLPTFREYDSEVLTFQPKVI